MRRVTLLCLLSVALFSSNVQVALADPPLPLPRLPVCGDQDGSEAPLEMQCSDFTHSPDVQIYRVPGTVPVELRFDFVYRYAGYNNELGFITVDNASGRIGGDRPGTSTYLQTAFEERATTVFPRGSDARTADYTVLVKGGDHLIFFIVQGDSFSSFLSHNPSNSLDGNPLAFFSLDTLNPDDTDHFVAFEGLDSDVVQFAFEDQTNGGDNDYDDVVYNVAGGLLPNTGVLSGQTPLPLLLVLLVLGGGVGTSLLFMRSRQKTRKVAPIARTLAMLHGTGGFIQGKAIPITRDGFIIGRGSDADLQLREPTISRHHVRLRHTQQGWYIQALGSTGGVFVNGQRVSAARLNPGDQITIGATSMVFQPPQGSQ